MQDIENACKEFESKFNISYAELSLTEIEAFDMKFNSISLYNDTLSNLTRKLSNSFKIQFYEDNSSKIEELETIKEKLKTEFEDIVDHYQNDKKLEFLLYNNEAIKKSYSAYIDEYQCFSKRLHAAIENLILNDFSPYVYEDSQTLYLINKNLELKNKAELSLYNITNFQHSKINIEDYNALTAASCIVQLPNKELFCYGKENPITGITLIIDLNSYTIKKILPSGENISQAGILYFQKCVYIFGGLETSAAGNFTFSKIVQRFDLTKNRWETLLSIPEQSMNCSVVPFKQRILLAGLSNEENIFEYDVNLDSFTKIKLESGEDSYKLLIVGNSRVYLFEGWENVWESEIDNEYFWNKIGKIDYSLIHAQSYRIRCRENVYLGLIEMNEKNIWCYSYYKFELKEKRLERIISIEGNIE
ncbi:unnamed protein product [Blepharisma stoltei]|uniref:Kelch motif family protein n=1 Tax=Blepharisma stoltei TaxID=1481888 RepID=A0AAU9IER6_9CILI|nr:unnamed protein product [Blepharisma stoltei]